MQILGGTKIRRDSYLVQPLLLNYLLDPVFFSWIFLIEELFEFHTCFELCYLLHYWGENKTSCACITTFLIVYYGDLRCHCFITNHECFITKHECFVAKFEYFYSRIVMKQWYLRAIAVQRLIRARPNYRVDLNWPPNRNVDRFKLEFAFSKIKH